MKINLISFNCRYSHSCLALFYIRNELNLHGEFDILMSQYTINDPYFQTLLDITGNSSDALFFSVYIWNADYLKRIIDDIKKVSPSLPIVIGGPQASALRKDLSYSVTVVHGEIEGINSDFYSDLQLNTLHVDYFCYFSDTYMFPYLEEDYNTHLLNRNMYYESSRGCPFSCSYCLSSVKRKVFVKDISIVKKELSTLIDQSPKIIRFVDRTFNADPKRTLEIWDYLKKKNNNKTSFHFEIAPDLFTEEMFEVLADIPSGLFQFEIGIQSTCKDVLSAVNRTMNVSKALSNIKRLVKLNTIHLHLDLILGLPFDTKESFIGSFLDVFKLSPHYIQMGLLKVLPDTPIHKSTKDHNMVYCQNPPYQILSNTWMDHETLSWLFHFGECFESFYNNRYFRTFFSFINKKEPTYIFSFFKELTNICLEENFFKLAKTQKFLCEILYKLSLKLEEKHIFREYLIYDWLLCGHRFLPDFFEINLNIYRDFIWKNLPEKISDVFDHHNRNDFFKRNVFYKFSPEFMNFFKSIENKGDMGYTVFFPFYETAVFKHCKVMIL